MCRKSIDMYTLKMEAASLVVQLGLVAPLVVNGSPDSKSGEPLSNSGAKAGKQRSNHKTKNI